SDAAHLHASRPTAFNQRAARTAAAAAPDAGPIAPHGPWCADQAVAREQCAANRRRLDGLLRACGGASGTARAGGHATYASGTSRIIERDLPDTRPGDPHAGARGGFPRGAVVAGESWRPTAFGPAARSPCRHA